MIIKKFLGKTEADATEQAKKELGPNVVIMNVKNVKRKGLLALLKPQRVAISKIFIPEPFFLKSWTAKFIFLFVI